MTENLTLRELVALYEGEFNDATIPLGEGQRLVRTMGREELMALVIAMDRTMRQLATLAETMESELMDYRAVERAKWVTSPVSPTKH